MSLSLLRKNSFTLKATLPFSPSSDALFLSFTRSLSLSLSQRLSHSKALSLSGGHSLSLLPSLCNAHRPVGGRLTVQMDRRKSMYRGSLSLVSRSIKSCVCHALDLIYNPLPFRCARHTSLLERFDFGVYDTPVSGGGPVVLTADLNRRGCLPARGGDQAGLVPQKAGINQLLPATCDL